MITELTMYNYYKFIGWLLNSVHSKNKIGHYARKLEALKSYRSSMKEVEVSQNLIKILRI